MLVISAGMQKSGSAYIYNLINELLVVSGFNDAREIKEKHNMGDIMKWHNNNIGSLEYKVLLKLLLLSQKEGKFVVKTHGGPTRFHNLLLKLRLIKTIYVYRDPRDVLISAQEHGKKILAQGENHTFSNLIRFDDAIEAVKTWTKIYKSYQKLNNVHLVSYEELTSNPVPTLKSICNYLDISVPEAEMKNILIKYDKNNAKANVKGLHFNKGIINRYRTVLTAEQIDQFKLEMGDVISEMGYDL